MSKDSTTIKSAISKHRDLLITGGTLDGTVQVNIYDDRRFASDVTVKLEDLEQALNKLEGVTASIKYETPLPKTPQEIGAVLYSKTGVTYVRYSKTGVGQWIASSGVRFPDRDMASAIQNGCLSTTPPKNV